MRRRVSFRFRRGGRSASADLLSQLSCQFPNVAQRRVITQVDRINLEIGGAGLHAQLKRRLQGPAEAAAFVVELAARRYRTELLKADGRLAAIRADPALRLEMMFIGPGGQ